MIKLPCIVMTGHEVQSGLDRVRLAEMLIEQLPQDHDGRNSWLMNYAKGAEAKAIRAKNPGVGELDALTEALPTVKKG